VRSPDEDHERRDHQRHRRGGDGSSQGVRQRLIAHPAVPAEDEQRQHQRGRLGEVGGGGESQGQRRDGRPLARAILHVEDGQDEEGRQDVLPSGNPGHRLDGGGMAGEEQAGQQRGHPRGGAADEEEGQHRGGREEHQVEGVEAGRVRGPEQPIGQIGEQVQRVVALELDAGEGSHHVAGDRPREERVIGEEAVVVPVHETGAERGAEHHHHGHHQRGRCERIGPPRARLGARISGPGFFLLRHGGGSGV
jgi:hypothetical protein